MPNAGIGLTITGLMNCIEYKKQKKKELLVQKRHLMPKFYVSNTTYYKLSAKHAIHSCNCDQRLTITSQQMIISAPYFELMCYFVLSMTRKNAMIFRTQLQFTYCKIRDTFYACVELWLNPTVFNVRETA